MQLYHDTFPHNDAAPTWPEFPTALPADLLDPVIDGGLMLCGNPEEVVEQLRIYEQTGVDQVVFGMPGNLAPDDALEMIETFGQHVIPAFDKDPRALDDALPRDGEAQVPGVQLSRRPTSRRSTTADAGECSRVTR